MAGAKSPSKSDFAPLAGRTVELWPDHDQPGADYIAAVEKLATEAGATVTYALRLEWFQRMRGEVGAAMLEMPKGWDAADAVNDGFTADNIKLLLARELVDHGNNTLLMHTPRQQAETMAATSANEAGVIAKDEEAATRRAEAKDLFKDSEFALIEFTKGYRNGVYYQQPFTEDETPKHPMWLCSPLVVCGEVRDDGQGNWGRLLSWNDGDGHPHQWACPAELLAASDTAEFRRELSREGLIISTNGKARQKLVDYVLGAKPLLEDRIRCVTKTGWFNGRYVLTNHTYGEAAGEAVIYQGAISRDFAAASDLVDWQREVSARAAGNSRIVFAISCAFAGALVDMAGESGGGFQYTGQTSKGKTSTLMDPAASVWGNPDRFAKKWRTTTNGIEALCQSRNDSILILDDLGQADPRECGAAAYLIANGQGKARMQKELTSRPLATWKTLLLSSGEIDLSQHMSDGGKVARGGQVARLPSIPADAGAGNYVIENLHDQIDGRQFADCMKHATRQAYGTAGAAYLEKLTEPVMLAEVKESIREAITEIVKLMRVPENAAPEVGRVAARFALVGFAGALATRFCVTGWKADEALKSALRCFNDWLKESGGAIGADEKALFAQVTAFMQAHGSSRFPPHDIEEEALRRVLNRAGFSFREGDEVKYWVESGAFKNELCKGFHPAGAAKSLTKAKWLEAGADRTQQKKRVTAIGGKGQWVYVLNEIAARGEE
jgi:putative DNA primase/helicase